MSEESGQVYIPLEEKVVFLYNQPSHNRLLLLPFFFSHRNHLLQLSSIFIAQLLFLLLLLFRNLLGFILNNLIIIKSN